MRCGDLSLCLAAIFDTDKRCFPARVLSIEVSMTQRHHRLRDRAEDPVQSLTSNRATAEFYQPRPARHRTPLRSEP
jgi:hypothetical protein